MRVTREELREGFAEVLYESHLIDTWAGLNPNGAERALWLQVASAGLDYLHEQGVVIKTGQVWCIDHGYPIPCAKCGATDGQTAVEPLVKDTRLLVRDTINEGLSDH